jgi:hypothetical protein
MRSPLVAALFALAACGGTTVSIDNGLDGGSSSDGASDGASPRDGTAPPVDGGGGGPCLGQIDCLCGKPYCDNGTWRCPNGCGDDCTSMQTQLDAMRTQLQTCCPQCKSIQCQNKAQDVCCEITVNGSDVSAFEALVTKYQNACHPACPAIACLPAPSGICDPSQNDPQNGLCR